MGVLRSDMIIENTTGTETEANKQVGRFYIWLKRRIWFVLVVIVPTTAAALYNGFVASDVYVSESRFVVKSPDQKRPQLTSLANIIQTTGLSSGQEQANEILEFVRSRDAVKELEKDISLTSKYSSNDIDALSRFPGPLEEGSFEDLYQYYGDKVGARLDSETGTAILTVKGFTAQSAYAVNEQLLKMSEALVNRLNERARTRAISEAQRQVTLAADRAKSARLALTQFRNSQQIIDPSKQASGVLEISNGLAGELAALQATLEAMQRATPSNPSIPALKSRIAAISAQTAIQDGRVTGTSNGIASKLGGYENLLVEQEFSTENLNAANAELVQARNQALRQQFYLERIVDPNLPDAPVLPKRILNTLVVAVAALLLYFIAWMIIVGILEHAPED